MTELDTSGDLVIHARRVLERVLSDPRRYASAAADVVADARLTGNHEALVVGLRASAWAERSGLALGVAKQQLDEAVRLARHNRLRHALADVLTTRAVINQELGHLAAAARDLDAAADLATADRLIEVTFQRAVLHQNIGRFAEAAAIYPQLLVNANASVRIKATAANNLALIEAQHGRHADAIRRLEHAKQLAAEAGPATVALVAQSLAWVTMQSGRLADALRLFSVAAEKYAAARLPMGEHYIEYADALMDLRLIPEAIDAADAAADEFGRSGIRLMGAEAMLRVAQLAMLAGDLAKAEEAARAAADTFARQGRTAWRARALLVGAEARLTARVATLSDLHSVNRVARRLKRHGASVAAVQAFLVAGRIATHLGRTREAIAAFQQANALASQAPILVRLRGRVANALAARLQHDERVVLAHCRRGLRDLARHRAALPSVELRALASGHGAELGRLGLEMVIRDGTAAQVFEWMERTRAAALLPIQPPDLAEIKDDLDALRAVHAELEALGPRPVRAHATVPLLARQRAIENRIRRATWQHTPAEADAGTVVSASALRQLLDDRVLVEYTLLNDHVVALVLQRRTGRVVRLTPVAAVLDQLRPLMFALRRLAYGRPVKGLTSARMSAELRIRRLSELLLRPLDLPAQAELVVVPVGPLHTVPWSALHDAPISLAPSATMWARTRSATECAGGNGVTLIAGPHLPGAVAEVRALHGTHPGATRVEPPESTAEVVARLLDGAELAHLACHGSLRSDNPMFSSLILSDGPLTMQELETRGVVPHRLVMAACKSGADVTFVGDEVVGFVGAMLARGTAGIVASMAAIPDVQSVDLMHVLHKHLAHGATLARALYDARNAVDRQDPGAYVTWCTFGAHGAA